MRNILSFLCAVFLFCEAAAAAELTIRVEPSVLSVGMTGKVVLTSTDQIEDIPSLPDIPGLRWNSRSLSQSSEISIVNWKRTTTYTVKIPFLAEQAGTVTIPAIKVKVKGKFRSTQPAKVMITPAGEITKASRKKTQPAFAELRIPDWTSESVCYVGQELPLQILLYIRSSVQAELESKPVLSTGSGVGIRLHDYRKTNPRLQDYESISQSRRKISGESFNVLLFTTSFRPLAAGKLNLKADVPISIITRSERDDFFGGFSSLLMSSESTEYTAQATLPEINVLPLPALPNGEPPFCGLSGKWTITGALSDPPYRVAEPLTLKLDLQGEGTPETFRPQTIELSGFRVYPPEVIRKEDGKIQVSYTLIPIREGNLAVKLALSAFRPDSGTYQPFRFEREIAVEKAAVMLNPGAVKNVVNAETPLAGPVQPKERQKHNDILYLHKEIQGGVRLPLWLNSLVKILTVLCAGAALFLFSLWFTWRKAAISGDPNKQRKQQAASRRSRLLKAIKATVPEQFDSALTSDIGSYVNDMLELPPGASLSEAADRVAAGNAEFSAALKQLSDTVWMPDRKKNLSESWKKTLLKGLARLSVIAVLLIPCRGTAADENETVKIPKNPEEALMAYDSGDFAGAAMFYRDALKKDKISPEALYDLGCCYYQMGELPRALTCFERASVLAPRDSDIMENLNLVRRKLFLEEKNKLEKPSDILPYLRDSLRLDEWIFLAACGITLLFVACTLLVCGKKRIGKVLVIVALFCSLCSAAAAISQYLALYSQQKALIITRNAVLYSLPSEKNGKNERQLKEGEEVQVEEKRLDWVRIRTGTEEGWVRRNDILYFWTHDQSDL